MSTTTNPETISESKKTPMLTFDECLAHFAEQMKESYTINEEGESITLPEDQMADITNIITVAQERVADCFKPLFSGIEKQIAENKKRIEQLQALVAKRTTATSAAGTAGQDDDGDGVEGPEGVEGAEGMPTVEWLLTNRKSKSDKALTGYNAFTMWFMAQNKSGFPPKGSWEQQNKAAWNALAAQVNKGGTAVATSTTKTPAAQIELPEIKGKGTKVTAYNMYTIEYMTKNPGAGFPPKGSWANVSKDEVARYQAMADAVKAQRA